MKNSTNTRADFCGNLLQVGDFVSCAVPGARLPFSPSFCWQIVGFDRTLAEISVPGYHQVWRVPARVLLKVED